MAEGWVKIGQVGVDSGRLMLIDPCYVKKGWEDSYDVENGEYRRLCNLTLSDKQAGVDEDLSAAVCSSGFGDGSYNVYVRYEQGRVKEMRVKFF